MTARSKLRISGSNIRNITQSLSFIRVCRKYLNRERRVNPSCACIHTCRFVFFVSSQRVLLAITKMFCRAWMLSIATSLVNMWQARRRKKLLSRRNGNEHARIKILFRTGQTSPRVNYDRGASSEKAAALSRSLWHLFTAALKLLWFSGCAPSLAAAVETRFARGGTDANRPLLQARRPTEAKLLLPHYGVIKRPADTRAPVKRNALRHSAGGEIGTNRSAVLINIRRDVSSRAKIYNLNKIHSPRALIYLLFFFPNDTTNGEFCILSLGNLIWILYVRARRANI